MHEQCLGTSGLTGDFAERGTYGETCTLMKPAIARPTSIAAIRPFHIGSLITTNPAFRFRRLDVIPEAPSRSMHPARSQAPAAALILWIPGCRIAECGITTLQASGDPPIRASCYIIAMYPFESFKLSIGDPYHAAPASLVLIVYTQERRNTEMITEMMRKQQGE